MKPIYREMKKVDQETLTHLILNLYKEDQGEISITEEKIQRTFRALLEHPEKGAIIVIEHDDKVIGYAILINYWSNEFGGNIITIDELYVAELFREQGIGTNFLQYLKRTLDSTTVAIQLEVEPKNTKAHALYIKLGFKPNKNIQMILCQNEAQAT